MNILGLNGFFLLPEEFEGTVSDALRLLAEYHESQKAQDQREVRADEDNSPMWPEFLKTIKQDKKVCMKISFGKHDGKNWEMRGPE